MAAYENEAELVRLQDEVESLKNQLAAEKDKTVKIKAAVAELMIKVQDAEQSANANVEKKIRSLAAFERKLREYYYRVCERYPLGDSVVKMGEFLDKMEETLLREYNLNVEEMDGDTQSESGFNLDDALNPTEDLESLCRDLGLID